jgi:para-nitrobenzyl esterase
VRACTPHPPPLSTVFLCDGTRVAGSNPSTTPPPDRLVEQGNLLFVSLNYRLGPFAFIASSAMEHGGGMLGILDQQAAMMWVQRHIAAFGGDPHRVTLMGESAGAISVCLHL